MRDTKFTLNALLIVVIIFSAFIFLITIKLAGLSSRLYVNEYYPIEGTGLGVRYSSEMPDGLYKGGSASKELKLEGTFGHDWGAVAQGNSLWLNEYVNTSLGFLLCRVVRVDTDSYASEVLLKDAILRGRCASGELVCVEGFLPPYAYPSSNALLNLYALSSSTVRSEGTGAWVCFLDPDSGETLLRLWDGEALTDKFEDRYLSRTLEEVRG